jgi:hypothetical protein
MAQFRVEIQISNITQCGIQNHFSLLTRGQLPKVPQKLEESKIPGQVRCADAAKHAQIGV